MPRPGPREGRQQAGPALEGVAQPTLWGWPVHEAVCLLLAEGAGTRSRQTIDVYLLIPTGFRQGPAKNSANSAFLQRPLSSSFKTFNCGNVEHIDKRRQNNATNLHVPKTQLQQGSVYTALFHL